jgi:hypothetical protein
MVPFVPPATLSLLDESVERPHPLTASTKAPAAAIARIFRIHFSCREFC